MMDVILQPDVQEVVIQKSTQIQEAKTSQNPVLDSFRVADHQEIGQTSQYKRVLSVLTRPAS